MFNFRVRFIASTHGGVLVTWRYPRGADCLRGFRVDFAATNERKFATLNEGHESIMNFYDRQGLAKKNLFVNFLVVVQLYHSSDN